MHRPILENTPKQSTEEVDMEAVRRQIKKRLAKASWNGCNLNKKMKPWTQEVDSEALRREAKDALEIASLCGSLQVTLAKKLKPATEENDIEV